MFPRNSTHLSEADVPCIAPGRATAGDTAHEARMRYEAYRCP